MMKKIKCKTPMTLDEAIKHCEEVAKEQEELYVLCPGSESEYLNTIYCDGTKDCKVLTNGKDKGCLKCAKEHRQLAEWLEELKMYKSLAPRELISEKQKNDRVIEYSKGFDYGFKIGYNKAIDDFLKNLYKIGECIDFDWEDMHKLAELLKELKQLREQRNMIEDSYKLL